MKSSYQNGLSVTYIRPFLLEKIDHNEGYNEEFWDMLLIIRKMVKLPISDYVANYYKEREQSDMSLEEVDMLLRNDDNR